MIDKVVAPSRPTRRRFTRSRSSSSCSSLSSSSSCSTDSSEKAPRRFHRKQRAAPPPAIVVDHEALHVTQLYEVGTSEWSERSALTQLEQRLHERHVRLASLLCIEAAKTEKTTEAAPPITDRVAAASPRFIPAQSPHHHNEVAPGSALRALSPEPPPRLVAQHTPEKVLPVRIVSSPTTVRRESIAKCGVSSDDNDDNDEEGVAGAMLHEHLPEAPMHRLGNRMIGIDLEPQEQLPDCTGLDCTPIVENGTSVQPLAATLAIHRTWCDMQSSPGDSARRARPLQLPPDASELRPTPPRLPSSFMTSASSRSRPQMDFVTPDRRRPHHGSVPTPSTHRVGSARQQSLQRTPLGMLAPMPHHLRHMTHQQAHDLYFASICVPQSFDQRLQRTSEEAQRAAREEVARIRHAAATFEETRRWMAEQRLQLQHKHERESAALRAAEDASWWALQLFHVTALSLHLHGHTTVSLQYEESGVSTAEPLWDGSAGVTVAAEEDWIRLLFQREECLMWLALMQNAALCRARACEATATLSSRSLARMSLCCSPRSTPDSGAHLEGNITPFNGSRPMSRSRSAVGAAPHFPGGAASLVAALPHLLVPTFQRPIVDRCGRTRFQFSFIPSSGASNALPHLERQQHSF